MIDGSASAIASRELFAEVSEVPLHRRDQARLLGARGCLERLERDVRVEGTVARLGRLARARKIERAVEECEDHR